MWTKYTVQRQEREKVRERERKRENEGNKLANFRFNCNRSE